MVISWSTVVLYNIIIGIANVTHSAYANNHASKKIGRPMRVMGGIQNAFGHNYTA